MIAVAVAPFGLGHHQPAARPAVLCDPVKGGKAACRFACRGGCVTNLGGQGGNPVIQAGVPCKPEQEVNVVVFAPCHQAVPGEATIPADEDAHSGPATSDLPHDPADVCQRFLSRVPVCCAQTGAEEMVPADGVVAVLPARHRNVPEWSLKETTARKDGR